MNENLFYSKHGLELTEQFEGFKAAAYQDQGGVWTIGYGHTLSVFPGRTISQAQAEHYLAIDVRVAENAVKRLVTVPLGQLMFDALTDFVFNCGSGNFAKSSLLKAVNNKDAAAVIAEFKKWDKIAGVSNKGLARRRLAESELYRQGIISEETT